MGKLLLGLLCLGQRVRPEADVLRTLGELGCIVDLLLEYLLGPEGDIENTRRVFYGQYQQLVSRGMWDMALTRMEGMIYNCFAMDSGLYVDRTVAFKQLDEQNAKLAELLDLFGQYRGHIPGYVEFKDSSDYHINT